VTQVTREPDGNPVNTLLSADVQRQLRALDNAITPALVQGSWALLTPCHEKLGYLAPRVTRDISYGPHERHRLDVHASDDLPPGAPVVLFAHGGGFVGGDKHVPGAPMYDHVGAWAVRHGWVGVTITYRLAPGHRWPAGAQDVAAAVRWTRENISGHGGDPDGLIVAGHSAGAVHVAGYLAGHGGGTTDGISGAALLSGIYDLADAHRGDPEQTYFGDHPASEVSSLPALVDSQVPVLFSVAEMDPGPFHRQAAGVVSAWFARHGTTPNLAWVPGHNHISEIASLGVDEDALGARLARFVARVTEPVKGA
jgi:acetyl esterase/lipase